MISPKADKIVEGFYEYLRKNGNTNLLPEVLYGLQNKIDENLKSVVVFSSSKLSKAQEDKIIKILKSNFEASVIDFKVDESLIGGIKIKIGSNILDLSVSKKLDQLNKSL